MNKPSPSGLGKYAKDYKLNTVKKGMDKKKWIVYKDKNGVKKWKHYKKNQKGGTPEIVSPFNVPISPVKEINGENNNNQNLGKMVNTLDKIELILKNPNKTFDRQKFRDNIGYLSSELISKLNSGNFYHQNHIVIFDVKGKDKNSGDIIFEFYATINGKKKEVGHLTIHEGESKTPKGAIHYVNTSKKKSITRTLFTNNQSPLRNNVVFSNNSSNLLRTYILNCITEVLNEFLN